jgi:hypothetical protein
VDCNLHEQLLQRGETSMAEDTPRFVLVSVRRDWVAKRLWRQTETDAERA